MKLRKQSSNPIMNKYLIFAISNISDTKIIIHTIQYYNAINNKINPTIKKITYKVVNETFMKAVYGKNRCWL